MQGYKFGSIEERADLGRIEGPRTLDETLKELISFNFNSEKKFKRRMLLTCRD